MGSVFILSAHIKQWAQQPIKSEQYVPTLKHQFDTRLLSTEKEND